MPFAYLSRDWVEKKEHQKKNFNMDRCLFERKKEQQSEKKNEKKTRY